MTASRSPVNGKGAEVGCAEGVPGPVGEDEQPGGEFGPPVAGGGDGERVEGRGRAVQVFQEPLRFKCPTQQGCCFAGAALGDIQVTQEKIAVGPGPELADVPRRLLQLPHLGTHLVGLAPHQVRIAA
ncbi:hypothetical protein [Streptomyces sp. NPDC048442]|uniref:hypothetical protein n=1 Tax=Streptomyces sp. NPDC048442 TaxID=3154823 RepID=UPI00341A865D